jgi:transposase
MPPKSKKQERLMRAVLNDPAFARQVGISQSVAREYLGEKPKKKAPRRRAR